VYTSGVTPHALAGVDDAEHARAVGFWVTLVDLRRTAVTREITIVEHHGVGVIRCGRTLARTCRVDWCCDCAGCICRHLLLHAHDGMVVTIQV